jgi:hypothetical protein
LKAEGIYVNLNLKVGYTFRPGADGVPTATIPTQSKPLHIFQPRMVALQKEFATAVIEALQLRDDPVLAMVEINNESSLIYSLQANQLEGTVTGLYRAEMQRQWNTFLSARYGATELLREAWGVTEPDSESLLPDRWQLELHANTAGSIATLAGGGGCRNPNRWSRPILRCRGRRVRMRRGRGIMWSFWRHWTRRIWRRY